MQAVAETGKPVVLCMLAGSDIDMSYGIEHFEAILQLWYPGARGGNAVGEILFGKNLLQGNFQLHYMKI